MGNLFYFWFIQGKLQILFFLRHLNFGAGIIIIFLILAHTVYKMCIIQEPNMLELWNKLHFEEENTESV